ncbi:MAG: hypothetical protein PF503_18695 [Desulfobacula sp.]|jgi:hypothetical protein|nr:hypothetical protein [Desulfobacula sp.]
MKDSDKDLIMEVSKLLLTGYFTYAKQKGLSEQEAEKAYRESRAQFAKNIPGNLEDV